MPSVIVTSMDGTEYEVPFSADETKAELCSRAKESMGLASKRAVELHHLDGTALINEGTLEDIGVVDGCCLSVIVQGYQECIVLERGRQYPSSTNLATELDILDEFIPDLPPEDRAENQDVADVVRPARITPTNQKSCLAIRLQRNNNIVLIEEAAIRYI